jgi:hypothetical protein
LKNVSFHHFYFIYMASTIDKMTWTFNCHSPMWLGKDHYAYDYKMTMHNDVDKYLQLTWNVMIYIIHHFVLGCMGVILGIFYEVWHAITWTMWQLMILQWLQIIWYGHRQTYPPPSYLPTYFPTHQPTYLPTHTPTYYLPTHPPTHLLTYYVPTYPPTYWPTHSPAYLPFTTCPLTYLSLISYLLQLVYYLPHNLVMIWNKHM